MRLNIELVVVRSELDKLIDKVIDARFFYEHDFFSDNFFRGSSCCCLEKILKVRRSHCLSESAGSGAADLRRRRACNLLHFSLLKLSRNILIESFFSHSIEFLGSLGLKIDIDALRPASWLVGLCERDPLSNETG